LRPNRERPPGALRRSGFTREGHRWRDRHEVCDSGRDGSSEMLPCLGAGWVGRVSRSQSFSRESLGRWWRKAAPFSHARLLLRPPPPPHSPCRCPRSVLPARRHFPTPPLPRRWLATRRPSRPRRRRLPCTPVTTSTADRRRSRRSREPPALRTDRLEGRHARLTERGRHVVPAQHCRNVAALRCAQCRPAICWLHSRA